MYMKIKKSKVTCIVFVAIACTKLPINLVFKIKTELLIWLWVLIRQEYQCYCGINNSDSTATATTHLTIFITNFWTLHLVYVYITVCLLMLLWYKFAYLTTPLQQQIYKY